MSRWRSVLPARTKLIMWGAADQARVNLPILRALGCTLIASVDDTPYLPSPFPGIEILRGHEGFDAWIRERDPDQFGFIAAIGNPFGHVRLKLANEMSKRGLVAISFADSSALICNSTEFGPGLQVMPFALVHNDVRIGHQCILNTRSVIEHDCTLEDGVEIGPGAVLCGRVHVGHHTWVGAGAIVRQRIKIGANCIVGAGATVVDDIPDGTVVVGTPARPIRK